MTIQEYEKIYSKYSKDEQANALNTLENKIAFLESIYMTGGENSYFSNEFRDAALEERNELCLMTSALHSILRSN